ncbi:MAG: HAMP domain-containing histidine kinase, partial [Campylobacterales bacterium]
EELIIQQGRNIAISDTLGTIAHHWRQPLNLLALYLQNIKEELLGDQINREELIQTIDKAIDSLLALSKTIDEFRGVFSIHDEERLFALADVIDEVCAIYRSEMAAYGITIALDLDRSILMNAKPTLLKQLLLNIITNAKESLIEHPVANAMITISLAREGSETVIAICNNGEAIPPEVLPKIFDPYFSTKKELQGTGLGLYMTKAIVEKQMNGTIMAENTPEGVCFKIRLPLSS